MVHSDSAAPQLMDTTEGLRMLSWMAVVIASRKPWSVLGAKVDGDPGRWSDGSYDLDIEKNFAVGAVGVAFGSVLRAVDRNGSDQGRGGYQPVEVSGEIGAAEPPPVLITATDCPVPFWAGNW